MQHIPSYAADPPPHDGVRDRFGWGRFASPGFLTTGVVLVVAIIVIGSLPPERRAAGDGTRAAHLVRLSAVQVAERVAETQERLPSSFTPPGEPSRVAE